MHSIAKSLLNGSKLCTGHLSQCWAITRQFPTISTEVIQKVFPVTMDFMKHYSIPSEIWVKNSILAARDSKIFVGA
jgi:hypothetical protein